MTIGDYNQNTYGAKVRFKFYGTKLRISHFSRYYNPDKIQVTIDGVVVGIYNSRNMNLMGCTLVFEKLDLSNGIHSVVVTNICNDPTNNIWYWDSIDIDSTGYLVHPILDQKTAIEDMEIGDCIPCRYTANTSSTIGYFSELGNCITNEIPVLGSATPNGLFYFIKADKGLLIADRAIQHSISWDKVNAAKYIDGRYGTNDSYYSGSNSVLLVSNNYSSNFTLYSSSNLQVTGRSTSSGSGQLNRSININNNVSSFYLKFKLKQFTMASLGFYLHHNNNTVNNIIGMSLSRNAISNGSIIVYNGDLLNKDIQIYGSKETGELIIRIDGQLVYYGSIAYTGSNWGTQQLFQQVYAASSTTNATIQFEYYTLNLYGVGTSSVLFLNSMTIRSLSGGNSYLGSDGNSNLSNQLLGAWPFNNEWDKYIKRSNLNGKIVPGDNNIWHKSYYSWCKETPVNNLTRSDSFLGSNSSRIERGGNNDEHLFNGSTWAGDQYVGFRPVIEYQDNSNSTNIWY